MSNHEYRDIDEASDARFDVPHTAARFEDGAEEIRPDAHDVAMGRVPNPLFDLPQPHRPYVAPAFGTGLSWQASMQSGIRIDLVNFPWAQGREDGQRPTVTNIELRTIYAHLIEAASAVRSEMFERGMRIDL